MTSRLPALVLWLFYAITSPLFADPVPGRWEKIAGLHPGTGIIVQLKGGDRLEGTFLKLEPEELAMMGADKSVHRLPRTEVGKILSLEKGSDRKRDGMLLGAGIGFGAGFLGLAAVNAHATASGPIWDGEALGYYTGAGLVVAGIGTALGAVIDSIHKEQTVLYQAR